MSQGTKHGSEHGNTVLYEEYYITRKGTKKMHFKYWEIYVKKAWDNHGIFKKAWEKTELPQK